MHQCCISQVVLEPDFTNPNWQAGFSTIAGGVVTLKALEQIRLEEGLSPSQAAARSPSLPAPPRSKTAKLNITLTATELTLLQQLAQADLTENVAPAIESAWFAIERILRQYAQYHFDYPIRSAALIDSCFAPA